MSWLSEWLDSRAGGPVQRFVSGMQALEDAGLRGLRRKLIGDLRGRILEIGCGTGFNFAHYAPAAEVIAIEPFAPFRDYAAQQTSGLAASITVQEGDAQQLAFAASEFDAVVGTLVFCSIPDPHCALAEIRRVAKPGAQLRLLEHVRHDRPLLGLLQDAVNPLWQVCEGNGCNLNRRTVQMIQRSGCTIQQMQRHALPGLEGVFFPLVEIYGQFESGRIP
jgi:SAM-dependent methyltransferase